MKTPSLLIALSLTASAQTPAAAPPEAFELPPVLKASELLPAEALQGPSHRVREQVVTDGYMAHFTIDTDFGVVHAAGVPEARQRIVETAAIRELVATSKSDLFAEGLKRSIEKPIDAVKNIADDPVESAKQVPKTVGHFFRKVGSSVERGVNKVTQRQDSGEETSAEDVGRSVGESAKSIAGFEEAKLNTARELGIDPYTDNARLKEEIDKVTWAFFAGGLPLRIGAAAASAGIALSATNMVGVPEDVYTLTASEIHLRDKDTLAAMGVRDADIDAFQVAPALSVSLQHRIVVSLGSLTGAKGRANVIQLATRCSSRQQAEFLAQSLAILAKRHQSESVNYTELRVLGRLPGAFTQTGEMEVAAPVDYVTWTQEVATAARRDDLGAAPKNLVHTGTLSPAAKTGFTAAGWKLTAIPYTAR